MRARAECTGPLFADYLEEFFLIADRERMLPVRL